MDHLSLSEIPFFQSRYLFNLALRKCKRIPNGSAAKDTGINHTLYTAP